MTRGSCDISNSAVTSPSRKGRRVSRSVSSVGIASCTPGMMPHPTDRWRLVASLGQVLAQEGHGTTVCELGRIGVELWPVRLHEPVLRARVDVCRASLTERPLQLRHLG